MNWLFLSIKICRISQINFTPFKKKSVTPFVTASVTQNFFVKVIIKRMRGGDYYKCDVCQLVSDPENSSPPEYRSVVQGSTDDLEGFLGNTSTTGIFRRGPPVSDEEERQRIVDESVRNFGGRRKKSKKTRKTRKSKKSKKSKRTRKRH
jgi:hypothetical protein